MGWPFSCLPDLVAEYRESGDYILSTGFDQFCWDVVDSSGEEEELAKLGGCLEKAFTAYGMEINAEKT